MATMASGSSFSSTTTAVDSAGADTTTLRNTAAADIPKISTPDAKPVDEKAALQARLPKSLRGKYRHVAAVHAQSRPSCLSHDSTTSPSFIGFRNLMVIVLVVGNLRLMIENLQKYGVLICLRCHDFRKHDVLLGLILYILIPFHLFAAYVIEQAAAQQSKGLRRRYSISRKEGTDGPNEDERRRFRRTWILIAWTHTVNITLALLITSYVVYYHIHHPFIGTLTELHAIIVWLKTASYAFTNRDLRHAYLHPAKGELDAVPSIYDECPYPKNITMRNLCYFWWAPTLVYQPVYPRTKTIRWVFVAKRVGEICCLTVFIWVLSAQYATPVLFNSLAKISALDFTSIVERLLKLSTISLVIWLAGFFALFQSFMNALAEVMCFGDRSFYDAWWNSESLGMYWRTWNKPVYQFFKRHVYSPMVGRGWSHGVASATVFLISAILHEVLVGIPTHNIIGVAFAGMFLQLPLIHLTQPLEKMKSANGKLLGNTIFWVSFTIFGQPFAALMYFYAWQVKYGSISAGVDLGQNMATRILLPGGPTA